MNIDEAIRLFNKFLNVSWITVNPLLSGRTYTSNESSINDWIQENWEILVERKVLKLNDYLEIYGDGADFNGSSSRITDVNKLPTHSVKILVNYAIDILNNIKIRNAEFTFDRLVGFRDAFYINNPLFNYVLVQDYSIDIERVFSIEDIKFILVKI